MELNVSSLRKMAEDSEKELNYKLKRLIRGLGSVNHKNKETNYALLCSHMKLTSNVSIEQVLEIAEHELHPSSNISKSEKGDIYFGRILLYGALIRSGILQTCSPEIEQKILEALINDSKQRSYLTHCASTFLNHYILNINEEHFKDQIWPILEKEIFKPWSEYTIDSLHTLLLLRKQFKSTVTGKELKKHIGSKDIITKESIPEILRILIEVPRIICTNHPVYQLVAEKVVEKGIAADLWNEFDKKFQRPSKTIEFVSVKMVEYFCNLDPNIIPDLVTPFFINFIIRCCQLSKNSKKDEATAQLRASLLKMINVVNQTDKQMEMLKKLMFHPGDLMFKLKTGIDIISIYYTKFTAENVKELVSIFKEIIMKDSKKNTDTEPVEWFNSERTVALQAMIRLLGHSSLIADHAWRLEQVLFLFENGLCEQEKVAGEFGVNMKESFLKAIDYKLASLSDLKSFLTSLVKTIDTNVVAEKTWTLRTPFEENILESWKKMLKFVKKLEKSSANKNIILTFGIMNLHMGLQFFQDPEVATSSIDELHICYQKIVSKKAEKTEEDEPQWIEVVVDLFLSLLSKKSHIFRTIVDSVFPNICEHLTTSAVHHILSVLNVNEEHPLSLKNGVDSDSSDSESESEDEDEDAEDEEDSDDDDDSDIEDENPNQMMMNQLKINLQQALGDAAAGTDIEDMDVDEMDEEEGKRLDLVLAAAFKVMRGSRNKKKQQKRDNEQLMHFRTRVIDLLEMYLDHSPLMSLTLDMIVPLFMLLEYSIQDASYTPMRNRVTACIKKLTSIKKFSNTEGVNEQIILDILKVLLEKGDRSAAIYLEVGNNLPRCCNFLIRCLQQTECPSEAITSYFGEKLAECFKKSLIPFLLFKSIFKINWDGILVLVPIAVTAAFDEHVRPYLKHHALEMLVAFYQNDRLFSVAKEKKKFISKLESDLYSNALQALEQMASSESKKNNKSQWITQLFLLIKIIHEKEATNCWKWDHVAQETDKIKQFVPKNARKAYNKLMNLKRTQEDSEPKKKKKKVC